VRADEKLTAFLELEAAIRAGSEAHPAQVAPDRITIQSQWISTDQLGKK
jgi:hypothetical protein